MTASTSGHVLVTAGAVAGAGPSLPAAETAALALRLRGLAAATLTVRANVADQPGEAEALDRAIRRCRAAAALAERHPGPVPRELLAVTDAIGDCARLTALGTAAHRTELLLLAAGAEQTLTRWALDRGPADRTTDLGNALLAAVHAFLTAGYPPGRR